MSYETLQALEAALGEEISPRPPMSPEAARRVLASALAQLGVTQPSAVATGASLESFLKSKHAKLLKLSRAEVAELRGCVWFGEDHEEPDDEAWSDFVRLRRRLKRKAR